MAKIALPLARHQLARAHPAAWSAMLADRPELAEEPLLVRWADEGWPLIGRRPACGDAVGQVPLGLPMPPLAGKRRLMLRLPPEALIDSAPPPLLEAAAVAAPAIWQSAIASLLSVDPRVRCFGSLAWQYLTRLPYLTESSDLDLLWAVGSGVEADLLAPRIAAIADRAPMRIDGEFVAPFGLAAQWREWLSPVDELVAKAPDGVRLVRREEFFA